MSNQRRSKPLYGSGAGALTPAYAARVRCRKCAEMSARIERFKKVIADKQAHIESQAAFIEKLKRVFREESIGPMRVTPLDRAARKGKL